MNDIVTIIDEKEYLKLMVRFVPKALCNGNKEGQDAIIRLCMECFHHGMMLQRDGKLEIKL